MNPLWIRAAILLAVFGAGWAVNGWRLGEKVASMQRDQAEATAAENETYRIKERANSKRLEDSRNEAAKRETTIRRDADGARNAADSLRDELAELRRNLPSLAADACRVRADTLAQLFDQCAGNYRGLAEKADRHASDVQTLMDGWPK
jgi:septal ring factor EnvC (AmiA/AmiB activator)